MNLNEFPVYRAEIKLEPDDNMAAACAVQLEGNIENSTKNSIVLEEKIKERCLVLEFEMKKKVEELQLLLTKYKTLEVEKIALEEQVKFWQNKSKALEDQLACIVADKKAGCNPEKVGDEITGVSMNDAKMKVDDESKVFQLMVENKVLECEKLSAQKEVKTWMQKCMDLESRLLMLEGSFGSGGMDGVVGRKVKDEEVVPCHLSGTKVADEAGGKETPYDAGANLRRVQAKIKTEECDPTGDASRPVTSTYGSPVKIPGVAQAIGSEVNPHARKRLAFENDGSPCKKMAPPTPGTQPTLIIDIDDSDEDCDMPLADFSTPKVHGKEMPCILPVASCNENEKKINCMIDSDDEDLISHQRNHSIVTPKRKRVANVVASDSESEDDDNIPIGRCLRKCSKNPIKKPLDSDVGHLVCSSSSNESAEDVECSAHHRRRLVKLSQCEERDYPRQTGHVSRSLETEGNRDEESEEDSSASGASLSSFIVESSNTSDGINDSHEPEDSSEDSNVDFGEIISKLRRNKVENFKWELEGDMLSAFGKDPELCMRAVCALYRQQTGDEKLHKEALVYNKRGFSKFDAHRGSNVAEFLTDGDPNGDLKKSVEELKQFDTNALELCMKLAKHYSKQLFEIYQSKEDPFWS